MPKKLTKCKIAAVGKWKNREDYDATNMTRWIANLNGTFTTDIDETTTHLVVGEDLWQKGCKQLQQAHDLIAKGHNIHIVTYDWLDDSLGKKAQLPEGKYLWDNMQQNPASSRAGKAAKEDANGASKSREQDGTQLEDHEKDDDPSKVFNELKETDVAAIFDRGAKQGASDVFSANYHVYKDATGFAYDVTLTKIDFLNNKNQRHVLTIHESNGQPTNYAVCVRSSGSGIAEEKRALTAIGSSWPAAWRHFTNFFEQETGIPWADRVEFAAERARRDNPSRFDSITPPTRTWPDELFSPAFQTTHYQYRPPRYGPTGAEGSQPAMTASSTNVKPADGIGAVSESEHQESLPGHDQATVADAADGAQRQSHPGGSVSDQLASQPTINDHPAEEALPSNDFELESAGHDDDPYSYKPFEMGSGGQQAEATYKDVDPTGSKVAMITEDEDMLENPETASSLMENGPNVANEARHQNEEDSHEDLADATKTDASDRVDGVTGDNRAKSASSDDRNQAENDVAEKHPDRVAAQARDQGGEHPQTEVASVLQTPALDEITRVVVAAADSIVKTGYAADNIVKAADAPDKAADTGAKEKAVPKMADPEAGDSIAGTKTSPGTDEPDAGESIAGAATKPGTGGPEAEESAAKTETDSGTEEPKAEEAITEAKTACEDVSKDQASANNKRQGDDLEPPELKKPKGETAPTGGPADASSPTSDYDI